MTRRQNETRADHNIAFIRKHLADANAIMDSAGSIGELDLDLYDTYSEETVFFCLGREYRGLDGIAEFLAPLAQYKQVHGEILDLFASDDRVCMVMKQSMERVSDGTLSDFERTVIYKVKDDIIVECWIADTPATWGIGVHQGAGV